MQKQKKLLVFLLLLLVIAVDVFLIATYVIDHFDKKQKMGNTAVFLNDASTITSVKYTVKDTVVHFIKEGDLWVWADDTSAELNQEMVAKTVSYCVNFNASGIIEEPGELDGYGLADPKYTVEFTTSDGKVTSFMIGDYFEMDSAFFAKINGDDNIYKISVYYVNALLDGGEKFLK